MSSDYIKSYCGAVLLSETDEMLTKLNAVLVNSQLKMLKHAYQF
jgi:hypothetical protein